MKSNFVFNLIQGIFTLVGLGLIIAGYFAAPESVTNDGFSLSKFFYSMGAFFIVWPLILFSIIKYFRRRAAQKIANLKVNGIIGKARVTGMWRTGLTVNSIPQMALNLDVKTDLGEHFTAIYKKCIDPLYYNFIRPDQDLPIYVDQNDRKSMYIDFENLWATASTEKKPANA